MDDECRRLAREGERATREGNAQKGIELLQAALTAGIDDINDLPLLSAIYSQLGNAYYAQKQYGKALQFHGNDLMLSRVQKDMVQQAKAYSNMSATYTMLNDFNQAITCADNVICLARKLNDKGLECRGLYNLGLAHLQDAIQGTHDSSDSVVFHLNEAVKRFEQHLELAKERKDDILCGLAVGNLGNAYFYLGDYEKSIGYHVRRLDMARAVGDKSSMRRSLTNMGNAYVLLGNYDEALRCYRSALEVASESGRKNIEAQLFFSLGNVESLRGNYKQAAAYYLRHLHLARALKDSAGETRANCSLASTLVQLNQLPRALYFLVANYELNGKLGDESMRKSTLDEIRKLVKLNPSSVVKDDRVCLDNSFYPDDISVDSSGEPNFATIEPGKVNEAVGTHSTELKVSSGLLAERATGDTAFQSMPNLSLSISLESFIRECARGSSSTPKRSATGIGVPLGADGMLPTPKSMSGSVGEGPMTGSCQQLQQHTESHSDTTSSDVGGLTKQTLLCSRGTAGDDEEDAMAELFFERLERMQGNRIDEQRADPLILKDRTNDERLSDSLQQPPSRNSGNRRMSLGMATMRSMGSHLQKNMLKGLSTSRLTSRLQPSSRQAAAGHAPRSTSSSNLRGRSNASSKFSAENAEGEHDERRRVTSPHFRVPKLPTIGKRDAAEQRDFNPKRMLATGNTKRENPETALLDLIESIQSRRMDEQRANLVLPGFKNHKQLLEKLTSNTSRHSEERVDRTTSLDEDSNIVDERLYDLIVQSQAYRIDDQRSELGGRQAGKKTGEDEDASRLVTPRTKGKKISRATSSHQ